MWRSLLAVNTSAPMTLAASHAAATMALNSAVTTRHVSRKVNAQYLLKGVSFMLAYIIIYLPYFFNDRIYTGK